MPLCSVQRNSTDGTNSYVVQYNHTVKTNICPFFSYLGKSKSCNSVITLSHSHNCGCLCQVALIPDTQSVVMKQMTCMYVSIGIAAATFPDSYSLMVTSLIRRSRHSKFPFHLTLTTFHETLPSPFLRSVIYKNGTIVV